MSLNEVIVFLACAALVVVIVVVGVSVSLPMSASAPTFRERCEAKGGEFVQLYRAPSFCLKPEIVIDREY